MQMEIEFYPPSRSTARQQGQRRRRLRDREQRLQRDGNQTTSLPIPLSSPAELTARQLAQRARRLLERELQPVIYPVANVPKALRNLHPNSCRHDLGPW